MLCSTERLLTAWRVDSSLYSAMAYYPISIVYFFPKEFGLKIKIREQRKSYETNFLIVLSCCKFICNFKSSCIVLKLLEIRDEMLNENYWDFEENWTIFISKILQRQKNRQKIHIVTFHSPSILQICLNLQKIESQLKICQLYLVGMRKFSGLIMISGNNLERFILLL